MLKSKITKIALIIIATIIIALAITLGLYNHFYLWIPHEKINKIEYDVVYVATNTVGIDGKFPLKQGNRIYIELDENGSYYMLEDNTHREDYTDVWGSYGYYYATGTYEKVDGGIDLHQQTSGELRFNSEQDKLDKKAYEITGFGYNTKEGWLDDDYMLETNESGYYIKFNKHKSDSTSNYYIFKTNEPPLPRSVDEFLEGYKKVREDLEVLI